MTAAVFSAAPGWLRWQWLRDADAPPSPWLSAAVGAALFALYAVTAQRTPGVQDSVIFSSACLTGDIAHAPGYPLFSLLCRPFSLLPVSPTFSASLFSAGCAALAAVWLVRIVYLLTRDLHAAVFAGGLLGLSQTYWGQATIPEVYALNVLLFMAALETALRFSRQPTAARWLGGLFLVGLGCSNHWPLFILAVFPLPLLLWSQRRWLAAQHRRPLMLCAGVGALALGLSPYLYMVWRTQNPLAYMYLPSAVDSFQVFWEVVSRAVLSGADNQDGAGWADKKQFAVFIFRRLLIDEFGIGAGLLLAVGFFTQWRRFSPLAATALVLSFGGAILALWSQLNFLYGGIGRETFMPYLLAPYAVACIWAAAALPPKVWRTPLFAVILVFSLWTNFYFNDKSRQEQWRQAMVDVHLETLPSGGFFPLSKIFNLLIFTQYTTGARPDLSVFRLPNPYLLETLAPGETLYAANALPYQEELERVNVYAEKHPTCYGSYIEFSGNMPSQEFLLFSCLRKPEAPAYIPNPEIDQFFYQLIESYPQLNWHQRELAARLLQNATYSLLFLRSRQQLPQSGQQLLDALSASPAGQLAALEYLRDLPDLVASVRRAEGIAAAAEDNLPLLNRHQQVRLLSAVASMYEAATGHPDALKRAADYHRRAAELIPAAHSPGVQHALAFYRRHAFNEEALALQARYGAALQGYDPRKIKE